MMTYPPIHGHDAQPVIKNKTQRFAGLLLMSALTFGTPLPLSAGPGHDHHEPQSTVQDKSNRPERRANGHVFLPKPAQHLLKVRTTMLKAERHQSVIELNGKVMLDPRSGGVVQTATGGLFEPPSKGLYTVGQRVKAGQLLGWVNTVQSPLERASQEAQLASLKAQLAIAEKRLARLEQLVDTVPGKDINNAQVEVESLKRQIDALGAGIRPREALRSPVAGVISASQAVNGRIYAPSEQLFEVLDPSVIRVEALWYDPLNIPLLDSATLLVGDSHTINLRFAGASGSVQEQAIRLIFETRDNTGNPVPVGQLVKLYAKRREQSVGMAVPASALVKDSSNQTAVWIKTRAEQFELRAVRTEPLSGDNVLVRQGLNTGERVVVQGANQINQIR